MPVNVVTTINGLCKRCYSCIRNCPVKAIKVENGQAMVVPELCIGCGNCVKVCSQNAKKIVSGKEAAVEALKAEKKIACIAPSFVVKYDCHPEQIVSSIKKLGFDEVWEVAYGALLVTKEYEKRIFSKEQEKSYISTPCPAVVNMIEKHYPELIEYLIPVVSPMIALGRYLKNYYYDPDCKVVFIGPCVAKKEEYLDPMIKGAVDEVLTFSELDEFFEENKIVPEDMLLEEFSNPPCFLGRAYPLSGGLLKNVGLKEDPLNCDVLKIEGRDNCIDFLEGLSKKKMSAKLVDILFCEGCIDGPALKSNKNNIEKQQIVANYTKQRMEDIDHTSIKIPDNINLSRGFRDRSHKLLQPNEKQIKAVLAELGKFTPEDELNCGACGYSTCRKKAIAVYQGLAESKMCLQLLISGLESHNIHLKKQLKNVIGIENMVGNSLAMQTVYQVVEKIAPTNSTVLLRGESGTGKDLIAQALHHKSLRSEKHFVSLNCAALPENLLESELFGHSKGAYTGAVNDKKGLFEEANDGTLFLDEIADISPKLQAKLLRVLQQGEFIRLGETISRKCDVRIIAATNQNLEYLIDKNKFREDLYYRLNVVSINLPALRERGEDIPVLTRFLLDKFNQKYSKNINSIDREAMVSLIDAKWPGNVRQLENAIERAVILCSDSEIKEKDLPPSVRKEYQVKDDLKIGANMNYKQAVKDYKIKIIRKALKQSDGVQARAAKLLGIGRSTLNEIIKKFDIKA
jgi:transcriptional regulator with PAS, ATPase and Fis domain/NAD-dependent dihydropyrimidine dehydrogenase PreA subunit